MTKMDIKKLADMARLHVSDEELRALENEIPDILSFVEQIQGVDVNGVEMVHTHRNVMREDADPHESGAYTEALLEAAPSREGDRVKVKQVLKK